MNRRGFLTGCLGGLASGWVSRRIAAEPSSRPIVVDAHVHAGYMGMWGQREISFEETLTAADAAGIDKLCVSSTLSLTLDMKEGNHAVYELMQRYPDRVIGFAALPSPYFGQQGLDEIKRAVEYYGMKGIGELVTRPTYPADLPGWTALLETAADLHVPVLLHPVAGPCARVAEAVPEATILLAHMGAGNGIAPNEWSDAIEMAKLHPNVYLETAQSDTSYGQMELAVQELGPERIVFGTDSPLLDPAVQKAKITGSDINSKAKDLILGPNLARILDISPNL